MIELTDSSREVIGFIDWLSLKDGETLAKLEELLKAVQEESYDKGFLDGESDGHCEGYAEGRAEGYQDGYSEGESAGIASCEG